MKLIRNIVFFVLVEALTHHAQCTAGPMKEGGKEALGGPTYHNDDFLAIKNTVSSDEEEDLKMIILERLLMSLQSELADMKEEVSALKHTEAFPPTSSKHGRSPRSTTVGTFSDYFGTLNTGAYGNCTCRGDPGPAGPPGISGRDGRDGRDALPTCHAGDQKTSMSGTPGNGIYVRWGRTVCREGSELVYEGMVGGSRYTNQGGGSDLQCLPLTPLYEQDLVTLGVQNNRAYVYGTEMQMSDMTDQEWTDMDDRGPPCAVCLALQKPTILMIPARNVCPSSNWTLEYNGLLMAEGHSHYRSEYTCFDRHPEAIAGTAANANGALLFPVEGRCIHGNSLSCPPYVDGNELSCAVCSL